MSITILRSIVLITLFALVSTCSKDEPGISLVECEELSVEIQFAVPDSMLQTIVEGGAEPYTYSWNDGSTERAVNQPIGGTTYTVMVTDALGCTVETSLETASDCELILFERNFEENGNTGTYTVNARSSAPPVTYEWSNGESGNSIPIIEAGTYVVSITDANGCLIGGLTTFNDGPNGLCQFGVRLYHREDNVVRISFRSGGTSGPFTYLWSDGSTERQINNPVPDSNYSVTVTNSAGCPTVGEISL